jgi:hypothetical protein
MLQPRCRERSRSIPGRALGVDVGIVDEPNAVLTLSSFGHRECGA